MLVLLQHRSIYNPIYNNLLTASSKGSRFRVRMSYLDLLGTVLEDIWAVGNRTIFTEALLETGDNTVHLVDLVLQVQRRIGSTEKTQRKLAVQPFIRAPTLFLDLPFCRNVVHRQRTNISEDWTLLNHTVHVDEYPGSN